MFCDNNIAVKNMESQNAKSWKINEIKFIKPTEQTQIINFDRIIKNLEHLLSEINSLMPKRRSENGETTGRRNSQFSAIRDQAVN